MKKLICLFALGCLISFSIQAQEETAKTKFYKAIVAEEIDGDLDKAIKIYQEILKTNKGDRQISAKSLYHLGLCYDKMESDKAMDYFVDLLEKYPDQADMASLARNQITKLDDANTFVDPRDGHKYKFVKIGNQIWMAENLAFMPWVNPPKKQEYGIWVYDYDGSDVAEAKATENYQKYGCLYDWPTAMALDPEYLQKDWGGERENHQGLCPPGWRVSSDKDWMELERYLGMPDSVVYFDGDDGNTRSGSDWRGYNQPPIADQMKTSHGWFKEGNGNNQSTFAILPGAERWSYTTNNFGGIGYSATFLTTTDTTYGSDYTTCSRQFASTSEDIYREKYYDRSNGFAVRCIKSSNTNPQSIQQNSLDWIKSKKLTPVTLIPSEQIVSLNQISSHKVNGTGNIRRDFIGFNVDSNYIYLVPGLSDSLFVLDINSLDTIWTYKAPSRIANSDIKILNGTIILSTNDKLIVLSSTTGEVIWKKNGMAYSNYANTHENFLYIILDDSLRSINIDTGQTLWTFPMENKIYGHLSISDTKVFVPVFHKSDKKNRSQGQKTLLFAIDRKTGEQIWEYANYGPAWHCYHLDNQVFINPSTNELGGYCIIIDGDTGKEINRTYISPSGSTSRFAQNENSLIYIASEWSRQPKLVSLNHSGDIKWSTKVNKCLGQVNKSPEIYKNQAFFLSEYDGEKAKLVSIDTESGRQKTIYNLPINPNTYPKFINNRMYIGSADGLFVFDMGTEN